MTASRDQCSLLTFDIYASSSSQSRGITLIRCPHDVISWQICVISKEYMMVYVCTACPCRTGETIESYSTHAQSQNKALARVIHSIGLTPEQTGHDICRRMGITADYI